MKKILLLSSACFVFSLPAMAEDAASHVDQKAAEMVKETITTMEKDVDVETKEGGEVVVTTTETVETVETVAEEEALAVEEAAEPEAVVETVTEVIGSVQKEVAVHPAAGAQWGYGPADGAVKWASLDAAYGDCASGTKQSPINIDKFLQEDLPDIMPGYQDAPLVVENSGQTVLVDFPVGSGFSAGGVQYELAHIGFHTPSEHYLDGAPYPMEVHLVHKKQGGGYGVIGVMVKVGAHNPTIEGIWQNVPSAGESKDVVGVSVNAGTLLPEALEYYKYDGSLTTPPCSEGVDWFVVKEPIEISTEQLVAFQSVFPVNARPIQPLNDRIITGD